MKSTKRVIAVVLAALMLACMIPFAVSAATPDKTTAVTLNCAQPGYTFKVYQLATLDYDADDNTKGTYTIGAVSNNIKDDIQKMGDTGIDSAKLLADCDAAYTAGTGFGTEVSTAQFVSSDTVTSKNVSLDAGVYYVVCTAHPSTVTSITNSVFATPYYHEETWKKVESINLGSKVESDEPTVDKTVKGADDTTWKESISESLGKTFQFKILTKVAGSATQPVTAYRVADKQSAGIDFVSVASVKTLKADKATVVNGNVAYTKEDTGLKDGATFAVKLNDVSVLYANDVKYVEVIYNAKLNNSAVVAGAGNNNEARLEWKAQGAADYDSIPWDDAKVYTYNVTIEKVDAANTATKLSGAEFAIYDNDKCTGNAIANATTGADGTAKFKSGNDEYKFKEGTYYFKETKAPAGYNLSSEIHSVTINANTSDTTANFSVVQIKNSKSVLPETGGEGTMVFTIVGISLILAAGVLFVIIMKKRASK